MSRPNVALNSASLPNFRTIARQLHSDMVAIAQVPSLARIIDRGRLPHEQRMLFVMLEHYRENSKTLLARHKLIKTIYDDDVMRNDAHATNALLIYLTGSPEYMCSGLASLDYDFRGVSLPPLQASSHLSVYTVSVPTGHVVTLSWRGKDSAAETLADSLRQLSKEDVPDALLRYAFEHIDNIYFAPLWWDALAPSVKESLLNRINGQVHSFYRRDGRAMRDDDISATNAEVQRIDVVGDWA